MDREDEVLESLYRLIAERWTQLRALRAAASETQAALGSLIVQALARGASGRGITRRTSVPEADVRRWARQAGPRRGVDAA